jgi:predicted DsbA family dithiol-disulfide isomerase
MASRILFFYDYVDPGSWLVERMVAEAEQGSRLVVERVPFEVTPPPGPLVDPRSEEWRRFWDGARAMAQEEGVILGSPRLVPWTRKAHELAEHAREHGRFAETHAALFEAFLVEGRDLGRVDVLMDVARKAGLDPSAARPVLDVDKHTETITAARERAEREGARGVPTLLAEPEGPRDVTLEGFRGRAATLEFLSRAAAR